jgi:hypothetical protein
MANLTGDVDNNAMKLGFGLGAFITFSMSDMVAIQPELLYVMKGTKDDDDAAEKLKLDYVQVPVLVKLNFQTASSFKPSVFAGPAVGILLSGKYGDVDVKDGFKSTDFGLVFGVGAEIGAGATGAFTLDARYDLGLSNILEDAGDFSVKTSNIGLFVGYSFL